MTKSSLTIPALIVVFGGGLAYWVMSNRDTTPVGLTVQSTVRGQELGEEKKYIVAFDPLDGSSNVAYGVSVGSI